MCYGSVVMTRMPTYRCETVDPQPRHLGMQCGFNFLVQVTFYHRGWGLCRAHPEQKLNQNHIIPIGAHGIPVVMVVGIITMLLERRGASTPGRSASCGEASTAFST